MRDTRKNTILIRSDLLVKSTLNECYPTSENMDDNKSDSEEVIEEVITEAATEIDSESTGRKVPVDPESTDLRPLEFHTQDWLLITEALYKTTSSSYSYTNYFEDRIDYARRLIPIVAAAADVPAGNIFDYIDTNWGEIDPSSVDPSRKASHNASIHVDPSEADRTVESFTALDWLIVAEALNAWCADLHLGGPLGPQRADERVETLLNAAVCAAGFTDVDDVLPVVRELFDEYQNTT